MIATIVPALYYFHIDSCNHLIMIYFQEQWLSLVVPTFSTERPLSYALPTSKEAIDVAQVFTTRFALSTDLYTDINQYQSILLSAVISFILLYLVVV